MPTTTTNYGRQNISWPDLGHDPGALLHSRIVGSITTISNQISRYWSGSQALVAAESANLVHNFNLPLTQLRVRIFESNAELSDALDSGFTLATVSNSTISITNTGLVTRTIEVYIEPRTRMRGEDLDPAIAISTTGNATVNDLIVSGNLTVNGTTTTVNSTTLEVADKNILVNNGGTDATAEGSGLDVEGTGNTVVGSLKYEAALASKWKVGATGTEKQIVTVSDTQVITEKDIDGGVASNARRITLPKGTKSALTALTRKAGTISYATDETNIYIDDGSTLKPVGGNWTVYASQTLISGGDVSLSLTTGLQLRPVSGAGELSLTPFGTTAPQDGTIVRLIGTSSENTVTILNYDDNYGAILNGDVTLGKGSMIELQWVSVLTRWIEVSRNMIGGI